MIQGHELPAILNAHDMREGGHDAIEQAPARGEVMPGGETYDPPELRKPRPVSPPCVSGTLEGPRESVRCTSQKVGDATDRGRGSAAARVGIAAASGKPAVDARVAIGDATCLYSPLMEVVHAEFLESAVSISVDRNPVAGNSSGNESTPWKFGPLEQAGAARPCEGSRLGPVDTVRWPCGRSGGCLVCGALM